MRLWTVDNVAAWVSGLPLSRDYGEDFRAEGIDGSCLDSLTSEELKNIGVMKIGDRLKILDKLRTVKVAEKLFSPSCSLERTQRLKGGGQLVVSQDPADHALWGPMHKKGQIPGTSVQWAQWYVKLDQLKADDELWLNFVQNLSAGAGDGVVDGCFFWGDFVVVDSVNPRGGGKGGVETTLDSMFDLTPLRIQQIFNRFDREGNLSLSLGELGMAFKHQGLSKVEKSLKDIVRVVDCNSDGRLTLPEFALALTCLKMADLLNAPHAKRKVKSSRLCVLDYCVEEATLLDVEDPVRFMFKNRAPGFIRWLQVRNATRLTMLLLSIKYHLHPLGVEDSLALLEGSEEQTKVDRYGSHFYVGLVFFYLTSTSPRVAFSTANISLFIAGAPKWDTLISILHGKQPPATARKDFRTSSAKSTEVASDADIWSILQENITTAHCRTRENKSDFLMQEILAACIQELKPIMQAYRQRIAQLHGTLLHEQVKFSKLAELSWISLELGELHRNIRPMKHVLRQLMEDATIAAECKMYLKDLQETIDQIVYDIFQLQETCKSLHQDYNRYNDVRLNDTLGILTVASSMFMPAQFLSGIYGMNFEHMPELEWVYGYGIFWLVLISYFIICGYFARDRFGDIWRESPPAMPDDVEAQSIPNRNDIKRISLFTKKESMQKDSDNSTTCSHVSSVSSF